jgi:hypothetical protein
MEIDRSADGLAETQAHEQVSIPVQPFPEYRHPRWLLRTATWGSALAYGGIFAGANILGYRGQVHGWPFVYMVREWRIQGPLTMVYGPWPLWSPPVVSVEPGLLLLNILCGTLLTCLAPVICLYWLRVRRRPLQFSLCTLFASTAVVACLLSLLRLLYPELGDWHWGALEIAWCFLRLTQVFVYFVPAALLFTAAHWAVLAGANAKLRSRWVGVHWLTWFAILVVGTSLIHYSAFTVTSYASYGWPLVYQTRPYAESMLTSRFISFLFPTTYLALPVGCLKAIGLTTNVLTWLAMIAATGFVIERWIGHVEQRIPSQSASILAGIVIVGGGILCILALDPSHRPEWYDYPSWLFAIACTLFVVQLVVFGSVRWLFGRFRR